MARAKPQLVHDDGTVAAVGRGGQPTRTWNRAHGMFVAGRAYIDEADMTAMEMEAKWGAGRLRLLVGPELREKFDRQRYLFNQAIWHGDLEGVRQQAGRMVKAWLALDRQAETLGQGKLSPQVWEITMDDGTVAAIVPDNASASLVQADGRALSVYTLDEIKRLLAGYPGLAKIKAAFPGASVVEVRRNLTDPLDAMRDSDRGIDEPLANDEIPF